MSDSVLVHELRGALRRGGEGPLAHRLAEEIWLRVVEGDLRTGARLPTIRHLSIELGVSPRSVERAYASLERRGVAVTRPGEGTFVTLAPPDGEERRRMQALNALCRDAVAKSREMGFTLNDLLDALVDHRETLPHLSPEEDHE